MFQFLQGLIKTMSKRNDIYEHIGFNSYKVWLKQGLSYCLAFEIKKFQFLQGLIKTPLIYMLVFVPALFQFLQGLIKTQFISTTSAFPLMFQFLQGLIKTAGNCISLILMLRFNSYKVWLKHSAPVVVTSSDHVSIPTRSD